MKYRPEFPQRVGGYEDALGFCRRFFHWCNNEHYHSGIGMLTPALLQDGQADEIRMAREQILGLAWQRNPERFVNGVPKPESLPKAVWIKPPSCQAEKKKEAPAVHCAEASEKRH
jgi:putative transposase